MTEPVDQLTMGNSKPATLSSEPALFEFARMTRSVQPAIEHFQLRHLLGAADATSVFFIDRGMGYVQLQVLRMFASE